MTSQYALLVMIMFFMTLMDLSAQSNELKSSSELQTNQPNKIYYQPFVIHDMTLATSVKPGLMQLRTQDHLPGFFCKMEYKLESKSKLAPRFRLGSLNYTNWMEGKGQLYSRYWK